MSEIRWTASPPGGPAGPFWSIVTETGRVIAVQVPDGETARMLIGLHEAAHDALQILKHRQGDVTLARAVEIAEEHLEDALAIADVPDRTGAVR